MREVSRQRERDVHGREEECWPWEKQLLTLLSTFLFFFFLWMKLQRHVAGFPNSVFLSTPLSALSQRNG